MDDRVIRAIEQAGLTAYREIIDSNLAPGIHIRTIPGDDQAVMPIGSSRIGGEPDVPPDFEWPMWKGKAQHFLAQINLADCAGMPGAEVLPNSGQLLFFYDRDRRTWGFDPKDRGSFHVCFLDDTVTEMARAAYPQEVTRPSWWRRMSSIADTFGTGLTLCRIKFESVLTLSHDWDKDLDADNERCLEFQFEILPRVMGIQEGDADNQILGCPTPVQDDMRLLCELVTNGHYCGDGRAYNQVDKEEYDSRSKDWILLFQFDSDENAGMMWGDVGMLYFMIRKQDLAARHFDRVWMILQSS